MLNMRGINKMRPGFFATFEGPEGVGKSTHIIKLYDRLTQYGYNVIKTREPGGTPLGESIRGLLQHDLGNEPPCAEAEVLLFAAARAQHVQRLILPAIKSGKVVLCDRFIHSSGSYQGLGRGFGYQTILDANHLAIKDCMPDLTFLIDIPYEESQRRLSARYSKNKETPDRIERESEDFHRRIRDGFLELQAKDPNRIILLNGMQEIDAVQSQIWEKLMENQLWREYAKPQTS